MKVDISRDVDCPQEVAFEYYSDRDADLEWWYGTIETRRTSDVQRGVGETNHQVQRFPGLPFVYDIDIEVIDWDPPHRWREVCDNGLAHYNVWYAVEKLDERRSRVRLYGECTLKGPFKLLYPIAGLILKRLTKANYDRLKSKLDELGARVR